MHRKTVEQHRLQLKKSPVLILPYVHLSLLTVSFAGLSLSRHQVLKYILQSHHFPIVSEINVLQHTGTLTTVKKKAFSQGNYNSQIILIYLFRFVGLSMQTNLVCFIVFILKLSLFIKVANHAIFKQDITVVMSVVSDPDVVI